MLVEYLSGTRASDEMLVDALLGEAETSLQSLEGAQIEEIVLPVIDRAKIEAGLEALRAARSRSSRSAEAEDEPPRVAPVLVEVAEDRPLPQSAVELDREIVHSCRELARRNLRIGALALVLLGARTWRRLGYATPRAVRP